MDWNGNLLGNEAPSPNPVSGITSLDSTGHAVVLNPLVNLNTRFVLTIQDGGPVIPTGTIFVGFRSINNGFGISSSAGSADAGIIVYYQLWQS